MRNWVNSLLITLLIVGPAAATPPQVVWVDDTLFAQTDDLLFVVRTIKDNHGSHLTTQTDTFLVTLSMQDGSLVDVAAIDRAVSHNVGEEDSDGTTYYPVANPVNPYTVRAQHAATPLETPIAQNYRRATLNADGLKIVEEDEISHGISFNDLRAQIGNSLTATRAVLPVFYDPLGVGADDADAFDPQRTDLLRDCVADLVRVQWHANIDFAALVHLSCVDWDDESTRDLWIVVPAI